MSVWIWIGIFAAWTLFTAWVVFWGGADWLEENWLVAFLIDYLSAKMTGEQMKLYFLCVWVFTALWFVVGVFTPEARSFWI